MAGIDTSIYGQLRPVQLDNPLDNFARVAQIQGVQQQNKLAELALGEKQRAVEQENKLSGLFRDSVGTDGKIDRNKLFSGAAQQGLGSQIPGLQKSFADQDKSQSDAQKSQLEAALKRFEIAGQIMGPVKDQASWDIARQQTAQMFGPEAAAQMPAVYDPALVEQKRLQSMSMKDQMEQRWKALTHNLNVDKFAYQQTNDAANRATTMRGQDMTQATAVRGQNLTEARGREVIDIARNKGAAGPGKPLPPNAVKLQNEELTAIGTASAIQADLSAIEKQIEDKKLKFGGARNLVNTGLNMAGMSTEESRNFSSFKSSLERLRNDSLRLNSGVQTDGDAQRAWSELFENINDTELVRQRLAEIKKINERAVKLRRMNIDTIRANYGHDPLDVSGYTNQEAAVGAANREDSNPAIDALLLKYGG